MGSIFCLVMALPIIRMATPINQRPTIQRAMASRTRMPRAMTNVQPFCNKSFTLVCMIFPPEKAKLAWNSEAGNYARDGITVRQEYSQKADRRTA